MAAQQRSPKRRRSFQPAHNIFKAIQNVSKTFQVTHAIALEAISAVGTDLEKLADYMRQRKV